MMEAKINNFRIVEGVRQIQLDCHTGCVGNDLNHSDIGQPTWSSIANWYDDLLTAGSGPHETAILCLANLLPEVDGLGVIDVACGQGIASRLLAQLGATVTGVDSSATMIDNARKHGTPQGAQINYVVDDAQTLSTLETASFDAATCQLALMDIPDLDACLGSIARVLRPGGSLTFLIGHPVFLAPDTAKFIDSGGQPGIQITGYFEETFWRSSNPEGVRRAGNHHRTFSTYLNALATAGFSIEQAAEPNANKLLAEQQPLYAKMPIFFAARARLTANDEQLGTTES